MPKMFGTDGVRGLANRDLTAQLALDLGDAAVRVLGDSGARLLRFRDDPSDESWMK